MKKMFFSAFILSLNIAASGCSSHSEVVPKKEEAPAAQVSIPAPSFKDKLKSCICTKMWMPVCGENKKTYGNSCEADCANVKYKAGECNEMK